MPTYLRDEDLVAFTGQQESQYLVRPSELADDVVARMAGQGRAQGGKLPWTKSHGKLTFRPGEVTIWAGVNGHGKSMLLCQAIAWWLPRQTVLLASLEMPHDATLVRMLRQTHGAELVPEAAAREWLAWTDDRLWLYDQLDTVQTERMVGVAHYGARALGVDHVVIDGLTKCGLAPDDYGGQKAFLDSLAWVVKNTPTHLHLVAHMRKGKTEDDRPDKFDVRGAGEIVDLADNLLMVWRNKPKERARERMDASRDHEPDATLTVAKQRHGEWEGALNLYYHATSQQFVGRSDIGAMAWPPLE